MRYWALHYANGDYWIGRFDGHWTRSSTLDGAALFESFEAADNAKQGFGAWFRSSSENKASWVYDVMGGVLEVVEVERIYRVVG